MARIIWTDVLQRYKCAKNTTKYKCTGRYVTGWTDNPTVLHLQQITFAWCGKPFKVNTLMQRTLFWLVCVYGTCVRAPCSHHWHLSICPTVALRLVFRRRRISVKCLARWRQLALLRVSICFESLISQMPTGLVVTVLQLGGYWPHSLQSQSQTQWFPSLSNS
jgi:hypothetical protein